MEEELEYEVVWSGELSRNGKGISILPDRDSKVTGFWTPPHRTYNKTGKYAKDPDFWTKQDRRFDAGTPDPIETNLEINYDGE